MEDGARVVYQLSGVTAHGQGVGIRLYGSKGYLHYDLASDQIFGSNKKSRSGEPEEIPIPDDKARTWQVEADFIEAIRNGKEIELTDFETGVAYMEFTEAVARSARRGEAVTLPLADLAK